MNDSFSILLAALAGVLLGIFFFGGLWWSLRRAMASPRPAIWVAVSMLVRMGGTAAGFVAVGAGDWRRMLACLVGFWAARWLVLRATAAPLDALPGASQESSGGVRTDAPPELTLESCNAPRP